MVFAMIERAKMVRVIRWVLNQLPDPLIDSKKYPDEIQRQHLQRLMNTIIAIKILMHALQIVLFGTADGFFSLLLTLVPYVSTLIGMKLGIRRHTCAIGFCFMFWFFATLASLLVRGSLAHFLPRAGLFILLAQYLHGTIGIVASYVCVICSYLLLSHSYILPSSILIAIHTYQEHFYTKLDLYGWIQERLSFQLAPSFQPSCNSMNVFDARHLMWEGAVSFTIVFMLQMLTEQAHRKVQAEMKSTAVHKSEFVARMSHELRTPLFGIVGCLEMMRLSKVDSHQKSLLQMAETCTKSLMALIDDILDMSRIEVGKMEFDISLVETHKLIDESLSVIWTLANKKGINLRQVRKAELPRFFLGDRIRNRQVLINLLSNSVKFTPTGGTITLYAKREPCICAPQTGEHWYSPCLPTASMDGQNVEGYMSFRVKDTGIGVDPQDMSRIFHPFEQVDVSVTRAFGGTGLGLTISASLVAQMGGQFFVSSEGKGKGATFQYFVPYITPTTKAPPSQGRTASPKAFTDRRRLLLAASRLSMPNLLHHKLNGREQVDSSSDDQQSASEAGTTSLNTSTAPVHPNYKVHPFESRSPRHHQGGGEWYPRSPDFTNIVISPNDHRRAVSEGKTLHGRMASPHGASLNRMGSSEELIDVVPPPRSRSAPPDIHKHPQPASMSDMIPMMGLPPAVFQEVTNQPLLSLGPLSRHFKGSASAQSSNRPTPSICSANDDKPTHIPAISGSSEGSHVDPSSILVLTGSILEGQNEHITSQNFESWKQNATTGQEGQTKAKEHAPFNPLLRSTDEFQIMKATSLLGRSTSGLDQDPGNSKIGDTLSPRAVRTRPITELIRPLPGTAESPKPFPRPSPPIDTLTINHRSPSDPLIPRESSSKRILQKVQLITKPDPSTNECNCSQESTIVHEEMSQSQDQLGDHLPSPVLGIRRASSSSETDPVFIVSPEHLSSDRDRETAGQILKSSTSPAPEPEPESIAHVLVAEDNPINQHILFLMLSRLGYKCDLAAHGLEVLSRVAERNYDLIFMDVEMPILPGLEATRRLRAQGVTTPIIALSAHVMGETKQSALDAGMDHFISKPVNVETLRKVLENWIPKASSSQ